jgi:hypothetical protein
MKSKYLARNLTCSPPLLQGGSEVCITCEHCRRYPFVTTMSHEPRWMPDFKIFVHSSCISCPASFNMEAETAPFCSCRSFGAELTITSTWYKSVNMTNVLHGCTRTLLIFLTRVQDRITGWWHDAPYQEIKVKTCTVLSPAPTADYSLTRSLAMQPAFTTASLPCVGLPRGGEATMLGSDPAAIYTKVWCH